MKTVFVKGLRIRRAKKEFQNKYKLSDDEMSCIFMIFNIIKNHFF